MALNPPKIGEICYSSATSPHKDAVHIAVLLCVADTRIYPGQNIGIRANGKASNFGTKHCGVVDPFIKGNIESDQQFYMFMYPNTVYDLHHVWEHDELKNKPQWPANTMPETRDHSVRSPYMGRVDAEPEDDDFDEKCPC